MGDDAVDVDDVPVGEEAVEEAAKETTSTEAEESESAEDVKETDEEQEAAGLSPELKKLIDAKYGGNQAKFLQGLYEGWNGTSKLAERLESLETMLRERDEQVDAVDEPDFESNHPELSWLKEQTTALDTSIEHEQGRSNALLGELSALNLKVAKLEGEASRAMDDDKDRLEDRIERLKEQATAKAERWMELKGKIEEFNQQKKALGRRVQQAEREIEGAKAQHKKAQVEDRAKKTEWRSDFFGAALGEAKEYGLEPDSEIYADMLETVRARASLFLRSLGPDGAEQDLQALAKELCKQYAKVHSLTKKAKAAQVGREKLQGATKPPVKTATGSTGQTSPKGQKLTADFVRKRAAQLLG